MRKPDWIKVRLGRGEAYTRLERLVESRGLHTVCQEALCPNRGECWRHGRATLMILGTTCSRHCRFCNVGGGRPSAVDGQEPERVAEAVALMALRDVVLTSVTRDDLPDGGAAIWARTITAVRRACPAIRVEVLIPDFGGEPSALECVLAAGPHVVGHNLETVPRLYAAVRPEADYERSLTVLRRVHAAGFLAKTGLMLGLGETDAEVEALLRAARAAGVDIFFAGQYLRPSRAHHPVHTYVPPGTFAYWERRARELGFAVALAAPLVRSSRHSEAQTALVIERLAAREAEGKG